MKEIAFESSPVCVTGPGPTLDAKLEFLASAAAHPGLSESPECLETHMSWVFFVRERVLKLKKPVRFPFLDFSSLAAREFYCREELRLNSRLAPGVYLGLYALQCTDTAFTLVPEERASAMADTVDWLVAMRRLPQERMLLRLIGGGGVERRDLDALLALLAAFYRSAEQVDVDGQEYVARFEREQASNREVLLRPQFQLRDAARVLRRLDAALVRHAHLLGERADRGRLVDGHGDLRPEHVWLTDPPVVIDCLEFNATLRQVDPFAEVVFLALECEMAGAVWLVPELQGGIAAALDDLPSSALTQLYTANLALRRARLAMAHLLDPAPRTPAHWPVLAQRYLDRAAAALDALEAVGGSFANAGRAQAAGSANAAERAINAAKNRGNP